MAHRNGEAASTGLSGGDGLKAGDVAERREPSNPKTESKQAYVPWRKRLPIHPAADKYPLLRDTNPEALRLIGEDIKQNGLRHKAVIAQLDGRTVLIDGRNRLDAMEVVGIPVVIDIDPKLRGSAYREQHDKLACVEFEWFGDDYYDSAVESYIASANLYRRQLTPKEWHAAFAERQARLIELIKKNPEKSDRQIAKEGGASPPHVGKIRKGLEKSGDVKTVYTRTDTKGRAQPAKKPAKLPVPPPKPGEIGSGWGRVVTVRDESPKHDHKKAAILMPTEDEAEESYQETLHDQACLLLESMADATRQKFFAHLKPPKQETKPQSDSTALVDFAKFTILNIDSGHLKLSGDPERYRRWKDLVARVKPLMGVSNG